MNERLNQYFLEAFIWAALGLIFWIVALLHKIPVHPRVAFVTFLGGFLLMIHASYCRYLYEKEKK